MTPKLTPAEEKSLTSKGGRLARRSMRDWLEGQIEKEVGNGASIAFQKTLHFVKTAQKRYKDRAGGL